MSRLRSALLAVALALVPTLAVADQRDPRLAALFAALRAATGPAQAGAVEEQIWAIWRIDGRGAATRLEDGEVAMAARHYDEAVRLFSAVIATEPTFAEAWNRRATAYYLKGDYDASVRDIQKVLELEPRHFGALSGLGLIYLAIERPDAAARSFAAALAIHPFLPGARAHLDRLAGETEGDPI
jgi:tetratricopeptide (TPR) repeat protein